MKMKKTGFFLLIGLIGEIISGGSFLHAELPQTELIQTESQTEPIQNKPIWNTVDEDSASISTFYSGDWREAFQNREKLPNSAKTRVWFWMLNSNIDKESITFNLEEMEKIGIGGLNLIDAGGAARPNGSVEVPVGPQFGSPEWNELFLHTLNEAQRLNIEIGLNIQSGWNLGGPDITPEEAAWTLETTETTIESEGDSPIDFDLPQPTTRHNFYRDIAVFAFPCPQENPIPKTLQTTQTPDASPSINKMTDGDSSSFWVSEVPAPVTLDFLFDRKTTFQGLTILPRDHYGPKKIAIYSDNNPNEPILEADLTETGLQTIHFPNLVTPSQSVSHDPKQNDHSAQSSSEPLSSGILADRLRLVILDSYDPRFPDQPRNAQICELHWLGPDFRPVPAPIANLADKTASRELRWSVPHSEFLLEDSPSVPGEVNANIHEIQDLSSFFIPVENSNSTETTLNQQPNQEPKRQPGHLYWKAPKGRWNIVRIGVTVGTHATVSTCTPGSGGLALNPLDPSAFNRYWNDNIEPLIQLAGNHVGTTWKYCHTDSWELGGVNWSNNFRDEFLKRRGYDLWFWLPVVAGKIVNSREESNRFLADLRKTVAECIAENHYDQMNLRAREHGMKIHPESGGPHGAPIDGLMNIGHSEIPMMEFWSKSKTHRVRVEDRHFVKQGSSAANIYNRHLVQAEGFTTIGPHWEETIWDNLRPTFDYAATEGLNRLIWHQFTCSPKSAGFPGQVYFAGTHCNPQTLWWAYGKTFFDYLNRSQFLLQQGIATADVLVYYGDWIPNFVRGKKDDPANILPGYDYDVVNEEALLTFATVKDQRIVFPSGAEYRLLVLPNRENISLPVLRKIEELVQAGAQVLGPKPTRTTGLNQGKIDDSEVQRIADSLWYPEDTNGQNELNKEKGFRSFENKGTIFWGTSAREILEKLQVVPALEIKFADSQSIPIVSDNAHTDGKIRHIGDPIAWVQRKTSDGTLIYLISNQADVPIEFTAIFREEKIQKNQPSQYNQLSQQKQRNLSNQQNKKDVQDIKNEIKEVPANFDGETKEIVSLNLLHCPELWNPVTGEIQPAIIRDRQPAFAHRDDIYRTSLDLRLEPFEGIYVIFREPDFRSSEEIASQTALTGHSKNYKQWKPIQTISGAWNVDFYRPENPEIIAFSRQFDELNDWSCSAENELKYFSGRATYQISFDWKRENDVPIFLDLGMLREIGRVRLNGVDLGVCWSFPFRIDISKTIRNGQNDLEIDVSNFWPNALIGDSQKPENERIYRTNVIKFNSDELLKASGLFGPVRLVSPSNF